MSNLTSRATVELQINGQQAEQRLQQLRQNALQLETALAKAAAAGNKVDLKRLRKELADTKRQIREMESSTMQVENVMRRLDRATPRELSKTLQNLNRQLEYIERGSSAWDEHVAKIRIVKAEIAKVNADLRATESIFQRMNRTLNEWGTAIMGAVAAVTGLVMAGRSAVSAYAEMDEELANTSKYTGMTRDSVDELNESFKKMDTRSSRNQLNELAQEAGRLGKNTIEDVRGYVEAADIINVALVDLGAGATQTIAKLSNIFGVEKILGTKDAMLAVGSTVNVLSQNCTASKPYLVEFAQRMAGIGAQADMTIPQILAFGAVLDSNGQKSEMASSALGKLTMMLFQDPAKMAKQVGLEVDKFTETMKRSTSEGLVMFLERIQQLGSKDGLAVLAPLFKDLGMDGVRMSQVLSTLAEHLDEVKWQFGEADKAFREASSATNEYIIFNNTVQAGIDKAKKRLSELSIELGEKLLPVMKHVYSSSSIMLRVLSTLVDFVISYKTEIVVATSALVAYKVASSAAAIATNAHAVATSVLSASQKVLTVTTATLRGAVILLQMGMAKLQGNYARLKLLQTELNAAMKANAIGLIAAAVVVLVAGLVKLYNRMNEISAKEKMMNDIRSTASSRMVEERSKIDLLVDAARNENLALDERKRAIDKLNAIIPNYNGQLDETTGKYKENKKALDDYITSLVKQYEIEGAQNKLKEIGKTRADLVVEREVAQKKLEEASKRASRSDRVVGHAGPDQSGTSVSHHIDTAKMLEAKRVVEEIDRKIAEEDKKIEQLKKAYGVEMQKAAVKDASLPSSDDVVTPVVSSSDSSSKDKFEAEKEWREREEALNRIAYAKGEKDYDAYTKRKDEIAVEFYAKELEHTELSQNERLSIEAEYYEALRKQREDGMKMSLSEEQNAYNEEVALLKQRFVDGLSSTEDYENAMELAELEHLRRLTIITEAGSKEREKAENDYRNKMVADQKRHQREYEDAEKKYQERLRKIKEYVFGLNPAERQAAFNSEMAMLREVFNMEILAAEDNAGEKLRIEKAFQEAKIALMREYNIEGKNQNSNFLKDWGEDITNWLDGDGGKAMMGTMETLISGMSSLFSGLTSLIQAETEIQTSAIEKRYAREISLCEGNTLMEKQLTKQKEAEIAKVKKEANKKMFAMQVIQAVAQTATSAINAYSSAAAIPVIGWIMAPIAAATAVAAGMVQIAAIKKQQQASEAQGYASGGYTPKGGKYEEVGVVHAGEWVASQELLANPVAAQMIGALDYAQRNNTIGSLSAEDVSSTITAPSVLAQSSNVMRSIPQQVIVQNIPSASDSSAISEYAETMRALKERLDLPFITVNSVTGDAGMEQAQNEYDRLIRNKTPKSRR